MTFRAAENRLFVPNNEVAADREMYKRSALHLHDVQRVADFYTPRNLSALAVLWDAIGRVADRRVRGALAFAFTNTAWHGTKMRRYNARGGHRPLTGTLYIPQLSSEANVFEVFDHKIEQLVRFYAELEEQLPNAPVPTVHLGSASDLSWIPSASIDYVFTDPPFGSNIFYADCNLIGESWLGSTGDTELEAVVNRSRTPEDGGKSIAAYQSILEASFREIHRVLKESRWATVVFQSSDGNVWHAIQEAANSAGFEVHSADILDKVQQSMKGYKGRSGAENVASFDIVLHLRKQRARLRNGISPSLRSTDDWASVIAGIRELLLALPPGDNGPRTLPYLYSFGVRTLLNGSRSVRGFSMERLRGILQDTMHEANGLWYVNQLATGNG